MEDKARVTEFGFQEIELLNGTKIKVRPFTFKEKNEYLKMLGQYKEGKPEDLASSYINMQIDVAFFIVSKNNPEITREIVEEFMNGEVLKKISDIAFYDPFSNLIAGK
jgi:hypothetical protein